MCILSLLVFWELPKNILVPKHTEAVSILSMKHNFFFEIIQIKRIRIQQTTLGKQPKHRSTCCNNKMFNPRDTSTLERVHIHASAYNFVLMRLSNLKLNGKGMKYLLDILSYLLLSVNQLKKGLKHSTSYYDYSWNYMLRTGIKDLSFSDRIVEHENLSSVRLNKETT